MLLATLPVRRAAFQLLRSGKAVSIDDVAGRTGHSPDAVRLAALDVASVGMAEVEDGSIVGMDGLTTRRTEHAIAVDGVDLWTWCAYDIVGIAAALGTDARGSTACGACGRPIEVEVRAGEPVESAIVGWLPGEACSNVRAFCPSALFFCSTKHLDGWLSPRTSTTAKRWTSALSRSAVARSGLSSSLDRRAEREPRVAAPSSVNWPVPQASSRRNTGARTSGRA
jgi:alkylmercury lyase